MPTLNIYRSATKRSYFELKTLPGLVCPFFHQLSCTPKIVIKVLLNLSLSSSVFFNFCYFFLNFETDLLQSAKQTLQDNAIGLRYLRSRIFKNFNSCFRPSFSTLSQSVLLISKLSHSIEERNHLKLKTQARFYPRRKKQGILAEGGRLSTFDLHIKVACFLKKVSNMFNTKRS